MMVSKRSGIGNIVIGVVWWSVLKDTRLRALMTLGRPGRVRQVLETICHLSADKIHRVEG